MTTALRWARRRLWSAPTGRSIGEVVRDQAVAYQRGMLIVRAFYALSFLWLTNHVNEMRGLRDADAVDPLWPSGWIDHVGLDAGRAIVFWGLALATLFAAALPQWRLARLLFFVALLQFLSIQFGFGKINHNFHGWLWISGILVLLPNRRWEARRGVGDRHYFLTVLWACQVAVLFFYTLTGLWKVYFALDALQGPLKSSLEIDGFSYILAQRILVTSQDTLLGEWFVLNPVPGWLLFTGTMYLETASLLIAFRPRLHRAWGLGLILFHLGTQVTMGFTFNGNLALLALFFVCSPAVPSTVGVRDAILDLPGLHFLSKRVAALRRRDPAREPEPETAPTPAPAPTPASTATP